MLSRLFIAALWSPAGKGLTSCSVGDIYYILVTFPCGILGQAWYLIVSFPDLCPLSYFNGQAKQGLNNFTEIMCMAVFKIIQNNIHPYHANIYVLKLLSVFNMLHIDVFKCTSDYFIMEANTMHPDQTTPLGAV